MELQGTGFSPGARVVVEQHGDENWIVWEGFSYTAKERTFHVQPGSCTDFASVPRMFVWYLPRYGPYTLAAVLHDHLWRTEVSRTDGRAIPYADADGIFRRAMRELDVPFLHRWLMWAAVRLGALVKRGGRTGWWAADGWKVVALAVAALPIMIGPVVQIFVALVEFYLLEVVLWVPLEINRRWRERRGLEVKKVVFPVFDLKLTAPGETGPCPPPGWEPRVRPSPDSAVAGGGSGGDGRAP